MCCQNAEGYVPGARLLARTLIQGRWGVFQKDLDIWEFPALPTEGVIFIFYLENNVC